MTPEILCHIYWAADAFSYQNVVDNFTQLLKLWNKWLKETVDTETRSKISEWKVQMKGLCCVFALINDIAVW